MHIYTHTTYAYVCTYIMHMYSYSNSKTLCSKLYPRTRRRVRIGAMQSNCFLKGWRHLYIVRSWCLISMTLGRNATTLPSSFIRKQWKQKVKTDHYPSPCIGQKTNRMGRKISNVSKVMIFTRSQARPNFPLESVLNNKLSRCVNARFTRWSLDNEDIVKTSQGCRQSIQKYCCGFTLDTTMVFYKSRSYIQR